MSRPATARLAAARRAAARRAPLAVTVCFVLVAGCAGAAQPEGSAPSRAESSPGTTSAAPGAADTSTARPRPGAVPEELQPAYDGEPTRPRTPGQAAAMIEAAQRVIRSEEAGPRLLTAAGHTEQLTIREIANTTGWLPRVLRRLEPRFRWQLRAGVAARREFRSMHASSPGDLATELPAWRIVDPAPARVLLRSYREAERRYGVDWEYLAAINMVETVFGRIRGTSVAGAQGPMQFIPTTWDIYGEGGDINNAHDAILAAARLLRANGFARDKGAALWRYNNHWAYVRGVTHHARVIARDPRQLRGYLGWQVYYLTRRGSVWLPTGYSHRQPVSVASYVRRHPERLP